MAAGHQLKKLAQSRTKGACFSLVDAVPKHWSVYTLLFATVFLFLLCFLLFDIRASPTALLLHAKHPLGALRAQAGEFYSQSTTTVTVATPDFRKGMQQEEHRPEDSDSDEDQEDSQKRKPKWSERIEEGKEPEGASEAISDSNPQKKLSAESRDEKSDGVGEELIVEPSADEAGVVQKDKTDEGNEERGRSEEVLMDVEKLYEGFVEKESRTQGVPGGVVKINEVEEEEEEKKERSTRETPEKQQQGESFTGSVGMVEEETSKKSGDKKVPPDLEGVEGSESEIENVNRRKKEKSRRYKQSKTGRKSWKKSPETSGQEILKEVTSHGGQCDYSVGEWVYDESYPLYKPNGCPFVDGGFRCVENGRPSAEFQKYRWQPHGCNLPRFDPKNMLEKLRGRRLAFVGDSIGRNNWESLLCMLAEAEPNKSRIYEINGEPISKHKGFLSFIFEEYNCTVEYYRSPYLVPQGRAPPKSAPQVHSTFKLDQIDWSANQWKDADILIFNSGHWWSFEKTLRGGNYFQVKDKVQMKMEVGDAFRLAMQTVAKYVDENVNPRKTQVFWRSYAPVHFRGGTWKTGGSCINEERPMVNLTQYQDPWVNQMIQDVTRRNRRTPMTFLNITLASEHRPDGHSSIWQNYPPSAINRQDCSHWCLPGVPDSWNEFLYAVLLDRGQGPWGDKTE